jgi:hypothetical protein
MDVAEIEKRVDRTIAGAVVVSSDVGGIKFASMIEVMEFAKMMAVAGAAVPSHLRANPGACLGIVVQALEWRMSPFAVANKSYIANDRIAYESQLIHAIVEARAPLKGRLRHEIVGVDDERRCKVWGTFKGESKPHEYISETLKSLRDARGKNDRGQVRGSPLWQTQPDVQLFYSASRTWARLYCPDVILGIYATDELPDREPEDVTPNKVEAYAQKLRDAKAARVDRGFDQAHVNDMASGRSSIIEGEIDSGLVNQEVTNDIDEHGVGGRSADSADRGKHADDKDAGKGVGGGPVEGVRANARSDAAKIEGKGEVGTPDPKAKGKGKR